MAGSAFARKCGREGRGFFPAISVAVLIASLMVVLVPRSAQAATETLFLKGDGVPTASLTASPPTAGTLPNYDPGRDSEAGLYLDKSDKGQAETNVKKYQLWISEQPVDLDGNVRLTFWSAVKDFKVDKAGFVVVYLMDCKTDGSACVLIDQGSAQFDPWNPSGTWVSRTIDFGNLTYGMASGRSLVIRMVIDKKSDENMLIAYDTTSYPSRLILQKQDPVTTTTAVTIPSTLPTTVPTTVLTTLPSGIPTIPPVTSTSLPDPPWVTTTTTTPGTGSTTTIPGGDTTSTVATGSTTTTGAVVTGGSGPADPGPPPSPPGAEPSDRGSSGSSASSWLTGLDPVLGSIGGSADSSQERSTGQFGLGELELVIPPWAAQLALGPLMIIGFVFDAMTDSGRALLLPMGLLLAGMAWVLIENRTFALAWIRRRRDTEEGLP